MDFSHFSHVLILLTTSIQQLTSAIRNPDQFDFLLDEVIETFNYLSSYLTDLRNS